MRVPEINEVIFTGRLTADPDMKTTGKGTQIANMRMAINRSRKDTNGEWKSDTTFTKVVAWGDLAVRCEKLSKGDPIMVFGSLRSNTWETKDGHKRTDLEVVAFKVYFFDNTKKASKSADIIGESDSVSDASTPETSIEDAPF